MRNLTLAIVAVLIASPAAYAAAPKYPQKVDTQGKPTPTEAKAVRSILGRSFGKEWTDYERSSGHPVSFTVGHGDLNGDGRPDLIVYLSDYDFGYCGSAGCAGYALMATAGGYAAKPIDLANFYGIVTALPTVHKGMHDLRYDDAHYIFKWNGTDYN